MFHPDIVHLYSFHYLPIIDSDSNLGSNDGFVVEQLSLQRQIGRIDRPQMIHDFDEP